MHLLGGDRAVTQDAATGDRLCKGLGVGVHR
jgi:hypothetical protein